MPYMNRKKPGEIELHVNKHKPVKKPEKEGRRFGK